MSLQREAVLKAKSGFGFYGDQAFTISARYIQNNKWFQNYSIWISQNGQWKQPEWRYQNGGFVSDYGIENIISYLVKFAIPFLRSSFLKPLADRLRP